MAEPRGLGKKHNAKRLLQYQALGQANSMCQKKLRETSLSPTDRAEVMAFYRHIQLALLKYADDCSVCDTELTLLLPITVTCVLSVKMNTSLLSEFNEKSFTHIFAVIKAAGIIPPIYLQYLHLGLK